MLQIAKFMSNQDRKQTASLIANTKEELLKGKQQGVAVKPLFLAAVGIVFVLSLLSILADLLTNLFGMIYPAYMSWKATERGDQQQKKIWLTYWIVFGLLSSIDDSFGFILDYVPGFYTIRFVIYVWLFYPRANNGASVIYTAIRPLLVKVKGKIDELNSQGRAKRA